MTFPAVTTLKSVMLLAHQQYGIRFQLSPAQLVSFANMIQMIAYNQDMAAFEEWNQKVFFGQDVYSNSTGYTSPVKSDIGLPVIGDTSGAIGTLLNYKTENRINQWIIEPTDGGGNFTLTDSEILTITGGTGVSVVSPGQSFNVSNGPYPAPRAATGNPPFRKFIGITKVTDRQIYGVPSSGLGDDQFDYGLDLNNFDGRKVNVPYRWNETRKEVTLITNDGPEILQTAMGAAAPATTRNDSAYRWVYYINPPTIDSIDDEDGVILPEEYRYEVLYKGVEALADTATYGDKGSVRELIEPICARFWEDKGVQFQAFGKANDFISHGDSWDDYGMGSQGRWHTHRNGGN